MMFILFVVANLIGLAASSAGEGLRFNYSPGAEGKADKVLKQIKNEFDHILNIAEGEAKKAEVIYVDKTGAQKALSEALNRSSVLKFITSTVFQSETKTSSERPSSTKPSSKSHGKKVLKLNGKTFDEAVMQSTLPVFVKFYAPWCGHCKAMEEDWKKLAKQVDPDSLIIAEVDADAEKDLAHQFGVRGFPTLKFFPGGKKSPSKIIDYDRPERTFNALLDFVKVHVKNFQGKIKQLTNQGMYDKDCSNKSCMITFLPHILDSSVAERKNYIKILNKVRAETADLPYEHFWVEASNSAELEEFFRLGFGWPATIIVNENKKMFVVHKGRTQVDDLVAFAQGVTTGRHTAEPFPASGTLPKWPEVEPWSAANSEKKGEL